MSTDEAFRGIVRAELRTFEERMHRLLKGGTSDDLCSVPKAARAVGLHPSTIRAQYLPRLTRHGSGRKVRISVSELRGLMRVEASGEESAAEVDAKAERLARKRSRRA